MRRLLHSLTALGALALVAPVARGAGPVHPVASARVHVVYPGQTLAMIAKRYNVSIEELCKANGLTKHSPIRPKQKLVIPHKGETVPAVLIKEEPERHAKADEHEPASTSFKRNPKKRGFVSLQSYTGAWHGQAVKGTKATDVAKTGFERVLAAWRTGQHQPINERLIRLVAKVSDHFGGRPIRVVSGFRPYSPTQYTPHSRHNTGHAIDFSIPGVPNTVLRDYCRTLPNVGVGYYPNSSFVHLDVRETPTYWVDFAGPGQAPRYADAQGRDPGEAQHADDEREEPATGSGDGSSSGEEM